MAARKKIFQRPRSSFLYTLQQKKRSRTYSGCIVRYLVKNQLSLCDCGPLFSLRLWCWVCELSKLLFYQPNTSPLRCEPVWLLRPIHYATIIVNQGYRTKINRVYHAQFHRSIDSKQWRAVLSVFKTLWNGHFSLNLGMERILMPQSKSYVEKGRTYWERFSPDIAFCKNLNVLSKLKGK